MRYIIMVTTNDRLYKFHENLKVEEKSPFLQVHFAQYVLLTTIIENFFFYLECFQFIFKCARRYWGFL